MLLHLGSIRWNKAKEGGRLGGEDTWSPNVVCKKAAAAQYSGQSWLEVAVSGPDAGGRSGLGLDCSEENRAKAESTSWQFP